jgi:yeast amino acid transporter
MVMLFPVLFVGWKIIHRTKMHKPHEVDLIKDVEEIDEYERNFVPQESTYVLED